MAAVSPTLYPGRVLLWTGLADVTLDLAGRADLRALRVLAELATGSSLPQQVPALVQLHLQVTQQRVLLGAVDRAGLDLLAQGVLLVHQRPDLVQQSGVVHGLLLRLGSRVEANPAGT